MSTYLRTSFLFLIAALVVSGCDQNGTVVSQEPEASVSQSSELQADPAASNESAVRSWRDLSAKELWHYVSRSDSLAHVGLKAPTATAGIVGGNVALTASQRRSAKANVTAVAGAHLLRETDDIPMLRLKIKNQGVLRALRNMPSVEYVEPAYIFSGSEDEKSIWNSGCGIDSPKNGVQTISTGDIMAVGLFNIGVDGAWARSTGTGVTIGVVGTGVSKDQPQLNG